MGRGKGRKVDKGKGFQPGADAVGRWGLPGGWGGLFHQFAALPDVEAGGIDEGAPREVAGAAGDFRPVGTRCLLPVVRRLFYSFGGLAYEEVEAPLGLGVGLLGGVVPCTM